MPLFDYNCTNCQNQWEEFSNYYNPEPNKCPECESEKIEKLITFTKAKGKVELSGHELRDHLKEEGQKLKKEVYASEKAYANVLGEARYQEAQKKIDKSRRDKGR